MNPSLAIVPPPLPGEPWAVQAASARPLVTMCDSAPAGITAMSHPDPRWGA